MSIHDNNTSKIYTDLTSVVDKALITSTIITGGVSLVAFASSVALSVGIALSETELSVTNY